MVEVTQEDRNAAADILDEISSLTQDDGIGQVADLIRDGEYDEHDTVQRTARHRQAGVQQGLDMAKAVVERRKVAAAKAFDHAVEVRHHEHQTRFACQHREAEECEAELSKLGGDGA